MALAGTIALASLLLAPAQRAGQQPRPTLADQVGKAIRKGANYLKESQQASGGWEEYAPTAGFKGGTTAMALLALLNAGVPSDDKVILKGLNYLRAFEDSPTYVQALQTMAYVEAGYDKDRSRIKYNVERFRKLCLTTKDGQFLGWNYGRGGVGGAPDNSNTHYALLALEAARRGGADVESAIGEKVGDYFARTQKKDGGWSYATEEDAGFGRGSSLTMAVAGVCGLLLQQREQWAVNGDPVATCGTYAHDPSLRRGLSYVASHFTIEVPGRTYYNLFGLQHLGRLSGLRFLGEHDWYREGCAYLLQQQAEDGHWAKVGVSGYDQMKVVSTSFALLFLAGSRTPVLITKLAHGHVPDWHRRNDQDWIRRRNDLRHLVDFASKQVFKKAPLAWQSFDLRQFPLVKDEEIAAAASELLESPIVYLTGHNDVNKRLTTGEKAVLKRYVEKGGLLLGVACCGAADFDKGFHQLCKEILGKELEPLGPGHAVWTAHTNVPPGSVKVEGLQLGGKTVVIYCPENVCGYWELNRNNDKAEGTRAFRLGANIIAHATGAQAPPPRLTNVPAIEKK
jgi:hypothetical protein